MQSLIQTRHHLAILTPCVLALMLLGGCQRQTPLKASSDARPVLVVLVHGTFAQDADWTDSSRAGSWAATLKSKLQRQDRVEAFQWSGELSHAARMQAAGRLAQYLDQPQLRESRVVLIGHSFGGSVATNACAQVHRPIEAVICLGTPHLYCVTPKGNLPIYVQPSTLENVGQIVTIAHADDKVAQEWPNALLTGVNELQARQSVNAWQTLLINNPPVPPQPRHQRLFESSCIFASRKLAVADREIWLDSDAPRVLGIQPHDDYFTESTAITIAQMIQK